MGKRRRENQKKRKRRASKRREGGGEREERRWEGEGGEREGRTGRNGFPFFFSFFPSLWVFSLCYPFYYFVFETKDWRVFFCFFFVLFFEPLQTKKKKSKQKIKSKSNKN